MRLKYLALLLVCLCPSVMLAQSQAATGTVDYSNVSTYKIPLVTNWNGKNVSFTAALTMAGTDGTTHTFPNNTGTVAETNFAQTFSTLQTFTAKLTTSTGAGTTPTCGSGVTSCMAFGESSSTTPTVSAGLDILWSSYANSCLMYSHNGSTLACLGTGGGGGSSGTITPSSALQIPVYTGSGSSTTVSGSSALTTDSSNNFHVGGGITDVNGGYTSYAGTVGTAFTLGGLEGTAPTAKTGWGIVWYDSSKHEELASNNNGGTKMIVAARPSPIHATAQTASISTATLCSASAGNCDQAGQYHVHFDFIETGTACSNVTAGSVQFKLTWTDSNATAHSAVVIPVLNQTSATAVAQGNSFTFATALANAGASGDFTFSTNGSVVQYATTYVACTTGTGTYQLDAAVTRLQ